MPATFSGSPPGPLLFSLGGGGGMCVIRAGGSCGLVEKQEHLPSLEGFLLRLFTAQLKFPFWVCSNLPAGWVHGHRFTFVCHRRCRRSPGLAPGAAPRPLTLHTCM